MGAARGGRRRGERRARQRDGCFEVPLVSAGATKNGDLNFLHREPCCGLSFLELGRPDGRSRCVFPPPGHEPVSQAGNR